MARAAEIIAERWTPLIVRELLRGTHRFSALRRGLPLISPSLLSKRLRELERAGVVARRRSTTDNALEYHLSAAGEELRPVITSLAAWGQRWTPRLAPRDLDPGLLMWELRCSIELGALPLRRAVIEFEFVDLPQSKRRWWLSIERAEVSLCTSSPAAEVDLGIAVDIATMVDVWLGEVALGDALRSGAMKLSGSPNLASRLSDWMGLSAFARQRREPAVPVGLHASREV